MHTFLVVDDSRTVRAVIKKSIRVAKIETKEVREAENGKIGLESALAGGVDIIIADINMPIMNGIEMIEQLKANETTREIPVIVVSTEGSQARLGRLEELGICGSLRKPFLPEDLRNLVNSALGVSGNE